MAVGITIYAELLATLRQVSVHVTFPSPADSSTRIQIIDAGERLLISHASNTHILRLPAAVSAPPVLPLTTLTLAPSRCSATWKLPLAATVAIPHYVHEHPHVPWEACDLTIGAPVKCRGCGGVLVEEGTVSAWKDLPSENWAEMMEFWHCHKPDVPHGIEEHTHLTQRAYGANGTIAAQKGVGFADLTSFLFVDSDVIGVQFTHLPQSPDTSPSNVSFAKPPPVPVHCSQCNLRVGSHDTPLTSTVLFKWQVHTASPVPPPSSITCLAGTFLATMSQSGYSKSILLPTPRLISSAPDRPIPTDSHKDLLYLWIINPNTTYSATDLVEAQTAIRLMFRFITATEADELLDGASSDVKELVWPEDAIKEAVTALEMTYRALPVEAREFQGWKVAMVDKWGRK